MSEKKKMNLPNRLTVLRIFCVPIFLALMLIGDLPMNFLWAGIVFALAMVTDLVDGRIARKYNMVTDFGKFWDPIADKLMTVTALIVIAAVKDSSVLATVVACAVLWRELIVTGLRLIAAGSGKVIGANIWGKLKTTFQCIYIGLELFLLFFAQIGLGDVELYANLIHPILFWASFVSGVIMLALTVWSGWTYYRDNREYIKM